MARHIWSLVSRESKIDADTNNLSINDLYESLQFSANTGGKGHDTTKPFLIPFDFEVTSLFYRDKKGAKEKCIERVVVLDPKGEKLGELKTEFTFEPEHGRMRNRIKYNTIALTRSGTYIFQIYVGKPGEEDMEMVSSIPVDIQVEIDGKIVK